MYGEPDVYEYAKAIQQYNEKISTAYCSCSHNNARWLGVYVTTPNGRYTIVHRDMFDKNYFISRSPERFGEYPRRLIKESFSSIEEALSFIENNQM